MKKADRLSFKPVDGQIFDIVLRNNYFKRMLINK